MGQTGSIQIWPGQSWTVVAPRAKWYLWYSHQGGYTHQGDEALFDQFPAEILVRLLAIPIRPRITSEFKTFQPSGAQYQIGWCGTGAVPNKSHQVTSKYSSEKRKADSNGLVKSSRHHKRAKPKDGDDISKSDRPTDIWSLPVELHRLIFSHIDDIDDIVCFRLTSQYFWAIGREYMHDYYASLIEAVLATLVYLTVTKQCNLPVLLGVLLLF